MKGVSSAPELRSNWAKIRKCAGFIWVRGFPSTSAEGVSRKLSKRPDTSLFALFARSGPHRRLHLLSTEMHQVRTNVTTLAVRRTVADEKRSTLRAQKR